MSEPYSLEFSLPASAIKSGNEVLRMSREQRAQYVAAIRGSVAMIVRPWMRPEKPLERARVTFTRYAPRPWDNQNFVTACKPILDGLQPEKIVKLRQGGRAGYGARFRVNRGCGVIVEDSLKHVAEVYHQGKAHKRDARIVVSVVSDRGSGMAG